MCDETLSVCTSTLRKSVAVRHSQWAFRKVDHRVARYFGRREEAEDAYYRAPKSVDICNLCWNLIIGSQRIACPSAIVARKQARTVGRLPAITRRSRAWLNIPDSGREHEPRRLRRGRILMLIPATGSTLL
jgi:hypothetical protein